MITKAVGEWLIWSGMTGVLSVLALVSMLDVVLQRNLPAVRGLMFIVLTGGAAVVMSGLPELLLPSTRPDVWLLLKTSLGPLSGALALYYLALWIDAAQEDEAIRLLGYWGSLASVISGGVLAALTVWGHGISPSVLLDLAEAVNLSAVVMALMITSRAVRLGDHLAKWMLAACVGLAFMVMGLYAKGMGWHPPSIVVWFLTAFATVAYFLIAIALTILRTRELRRLKRTAKGVLEAQVDLPMAQGATLVPRIEDAIWRAFRMQRHCVVAAVSVRNLYEHGALVSTGAEGNILATMAARIRRKVGFRNVVGLYHPRCFIMAISSSHDPRRGHLEFDALLEELRRPVPIPLEGQTVQFVPEVGVGVVPLRDANVPALEAINEAERLSFVQGINIARDGDVADTLPPAALMI